MIFLFCLQEIVQASEVKKDSFWKFKGLTDDVVFVVEKVESNKVFYKERNIKQKPTIRELSDFKLNFEKEKK